MKLSVWEVVRGTLAEGEGVGGLKETEELQGNVTESVTVGGVPLTVSSAVSEGVGVRLGVGVGRLGVRVPLTLRLTDGGDRVWEEEHVGLGGDGVHVAVPETERDAEPGLTVAVGEWEGDAVGERVAGERVGDGVGVPVPVRVVKVVLGVAVCVLLVREIMVGEGVRVVGEREVE